MPPPEMASDPDTLRGIAQAPFARLAARALPPGSPSAFTLVAHGGAADLRTWPEARRARFFAAARVVLTALLQAGAGALAAGATALDVVEACVCALEDCAVFNAGRGAARSRTGEVQLDAAIMDGRDRSAGAVAATRRLRNPVRAARLVLERTPHVLLAGPDADAFCAAEGLPLVDSAYFAAEPGGGTGDTVGAVARDRHGNLAAATSTGGLAGKLPGRVGDSPLIGAGTFADNRSVAVSGTGLGEYFMRSVLAHEVAARVRHRGLPVRRAVDEAVHGELATLGGRGGLIAVSADGIPAIACNMQFLPRGVVSERGLPEVTV